MSSAAGQKALSAAIKQKRFDPVYLLYGDDDYRKNDAVRQILEAAVDPVTRDFNLEIRRGPELNGETLASLLAMPPMMADLRAVVVRDVGGLKKDARAALDAYLQRPASDTLLVLVAPAGQKLEKGMGAAATAIDFEAPKPHEVPKWIVKHAASHHEATVTEPAAALLAESVGQDLGQAAIELEKLASYAGSAPIDVEAVEAIVGVRRDATMAHLLDAVAERNAPRALELIPIVMEQPRSSAVLAVMLLTVQTMGIGWTRARLDRRMPAARLGGDIMGLFKQTGAFPGRPWGEAARVWVSVADRWSERDVASALERLLAADRALKDSRVSSDDGILTSLVLELCGGTSQRSAA